MESKYAIGLLLQGFEHKRIQEFGLGAAQKRNVPTHGQLVTNFVSCYQFFDRSANNLKKGTITYGGVGADFQAPGIVTFQSHML